MVIRLYAAVQVDSLVLDSQAVDILVWGTQVSAILIIDNKQLIK